MALIPHNFFGRNQFDMDTWRQPNWTGPTTLDMFDPFDQMDRMMGRNFQWLNNPFDNTNLPADVPNKYRINVDCEGICPENIKISFSDDHRKLFVSGVEEKNKDDLENYSHNEFKRTFNLPDKLDWQHMASFVTGSNQLVIEFPWRSENQDWSMMPRVVEDSKDHHKSVLMDMHVPDGIDPKHVKVTCKDRDLIVQAHEKKKNKDNFYETSYYRRCTLPENTDWDKLKCYLDDHHNLSIQAPLWEGNNKKAIKN